MKIYDNKKTGLSTISGKIESISDDRLNLTVKTQVYDAATKTRNDTSVPVSLESTFEENASVGQNITVVGFKNPRTKSYDAMFVSTGSGSFDYDALSVVSGDVIFAGYNEEKNEDGSVKMSREYTTASGEVVAPHAKKPHFDIGISTEELDSETGKTRRVLHTIKEYPYNGDMTKVERYKKLFANFNKETNPVYATIVTAPAEIKPREHEYNGKVYTNYYANHMGTNMVDVVFEKALMKETETSKDEEAPAPEVSLPQGVTLPDTPTVGTQPVSREEINGLEEDPIPEILDDDGLFAE